MKIDELPDDALLKAREFVRSRGQVGLVPHGLTRWRQLVSEGKAPSPEYPFGRSVALWRLGDLRAYLRALRPDAGRN